MLQNGCTVKCCIFLRFSRPIVWKYWPQLCSLSPYAHRSAISLLQFHSLHITAQPPVRLFGQTGLGHFPLSISIDDGSVALGGIPKTPGTISPDGPAGRSPKLFQRSACCRGHCRRRLWGVAGVILRAGFGSGRFSRVLTFSNLLARAGPCPFVLCYKRDGS
ncbi:uncharacterized protein PpBr36_09848 [Pyricularia pennisetigena]|uniref:uncharacterized protein n=1 Tax=Pyricularia pennisetigena TaxID=1578925 RepID=UPI001152291C|nr:uncharacterized protein PpBr36_09848 [Pyricularia pennisetigena]TLS22494.1 hypothetical protein PpBr36_09848 [Pyricularia pennisetigena]